MRRGSGAQHSPTHRAVRCVIGFVAVVGVCCLLAPARPPPPAPVRSVSDALPSVVAEPEAANIKAAPQALRRRGAELRVRNGQPPVVPGWDAGLPKDEVRERERVEALSRGRLPADWESVDRAWAEDEVLGEPEDAGPATPARDRRICPPLAAESLGS